MQCVNLIPAPRRAAQRRRRKLRRCGILCAAYVGLLAAVQVFCYGAWGARAAPIASQMRQTSQRIRRVGDEIRQLKTNIRQDQLKLAANQAVGDQPDWSLLLYKVASVVDEKIVLRRFYLRPALVPDAKGRTVQPDVTRMSPEHASGQTGGYDLELSGWAADQADVWNLAMQLERTGLFASVKVASSGKEVYMNRPATGFTLICRLGGGAEQ
jgi:hypothetical protein